MAEVSIMVEEKSVEPEWCGTTRRGGQEEKDWEGQR